MSDNERYLEEVPAAPKPLRLQQVAQRAGRLKTKFVNLGHIEGWEPGEGVWVRELSAGERSKARAMMGEFRSTESGDTIIDFRKVDPDSDAKLVWWATLDVDEAGDPIPDSQLFSATKLVDAGFGKLKPFDFIQSLGSEFVDEVVKVIRELSGLAKDAKESEKND